MMRSLSISPDKCTGCLQCELACSYHHEGVFNPARSRIKVFAFHHEGRYVPYTCTQCADAWCRNACPTEAITGERKSLHALDQEKCISCGACYDVCSRDAIRFYSKHEATHADAHD